MHPHRKDERAYVVYVIAFIVIVWNAIVKHEIHRFTNMSAAHVTYILFYIHRLSVMIPRVE